MKKPLWAVAYKIIYGVYPIAGGGGTKPQPAQVISLPQQPPAPSASESAESIYQARLKYDPQIAQREFEIQQQQMPQMAALEAALYRQYYPEYARSQQQLQQELYPQQSRILEAGAGRALERLDSPFGYTPEEQQALDAIRQRQREQTTRNIRESANLGGGLYGGRRELREDRAMTELEQAFGAEDINRRLQGGYQAQQAAIPYMQILYPQVGTQQPQFQPFQYQSTTPDPSQLYNAMYGAGRRDYAVQPAMAGSPSPLWGIAGQAAGGVGAGWAGKFFK
jgi:hypothetical protein